MSQSEVNVPALAPTLFEMRGVVMDVRAGDAPDADGADGAVVVAHRERYHLWYTAQSGPKRSAFAIR